MAEQAPEKLTEEPAPTFVDGGQAIDRIKALGETARAAWFVLLGYLAFVGITLLGVQDLDFFSAAARTQLPLVGISIPTMTFFFIAPILGSALHVYLHLYLVKLWDALAEARETVNRRPLGDRVFPWLVVDWALRLRRDEAIRTRPLDRLGNLVMAGLVWLAAPIVLGCFWCRSATAHDPWLTLMIAAAFAISIYASFRGWQHAEARLRHAGREPPAPPRWRIRLWRWGVLPLALAVLVIASWLRTEGGLDYYADRMVATIGPWVGLTFELGRDEWGNSISAEEVRQEWVRERFPTLGSVSHLDDKGGMKWTGVVVPISRTPLARIDLTGAEVAARPADWLGHDTANRRFRIDWCKDGGLPPDACALPPLAPYQIAARDTWCKKRKINDCRTAFQALDDAFHSEWAEQRQEYLANINQVDLSGRDLRHATISGAFLARVDLREARLQGADLTWVRLEGANLRGAWLDGAYLYRARLEGADLTEARLAGASLYRAWLQGADLTWVRLEKANLRRARLEGAKLYGARLQEADLTEARLDGADLRQARLEGANLRLARLEGAYLNQARLEGAKLYGARLGGAYLGSANLTGSQRLTQSQLAQVIGNNTTILPLDAKTGAQLHVCSCWTEPPATLEQLLVDVFPDYRREDVRAEWLCDSGEQPRAVGRSAETGEPVVDRGQCRVAAAE